MPFITFFFVFISVIAQASKEDCPSYAVDTQFMAQHFDQGNARLCFAFAASDLISHALKKKILPYDVALKVFHDDQTRENQIAAHKRKMPENVELHGGHIDSAMSVVNGKEICLNDQKFTYENKWEELSDIFTFLARSNPETEMTSRLSFDAQLEKSTHFNQVITTERHLDRLDKIFDKLCGDHRILIDLSSQQFVTKEFQNGRLFWNTRAPREEDLIFEMATALKSGNPLGIEYDISSIREISGPHASTIVEMKYDEEKKQCLALVKDSHGQICNTAARNVTCIEGQYWVSTKQLMETLIYTIWLQDKVAREPAKAHKNILPAKKLPIKKIF